MKKQAIILLLSLVFTLTTNTNAQVVRNRTAKDSLEKIIIKQSGFMKDDEIIIIYRSSDHTIVEVIDKGDDISKQYHHKYESILQSYIELRNIESIKSRIDILKRELRGKSRLDSAELNRFRLIDENLTGLRSRLIKNNNRRSDLLLEKTIGLERQMVEVREIQSVTSEYGNKLENFLNRLLDEKIIKSKKNLEFRVRYGKCRINGEKVTSDTFKRIKEIYKKIFNKEINSKKYTIIK